jgi:hypothetical protein
MRLNYDQILPKILRELTGDEGHPVDFGEHKNATDFTQDEEGETTTIPVQSYFRNLDGSPKTNITARLFSLDKVSRVFGERLGFSFFSKDQVSSFLATLEKLGAGPEEMVRAAKWLENVPANGQNLDEALWRIYGVDPAAFAEGGDLLASTEAFFRATFKAKGWSDGDIEFAVQQGMQVARMFQGIIPQTKVVRAKAEGANFALEPTFGRNNPLVALLEEQGADRFGPDAELTRMVFALSHELNHIVKLMADAKPEALPADVRLAIQEAQLEAAKMTPQEMATSITEMLRTVLPKGDLRERMLVEAQKRYSSANVEEFLADYGGLMVLSRLHPLDVSGHLMLQNRTTFRFARAIARWFGSIIDSIVRTFKQAFGVPIKGLSKIKESLETIISVGDKADVMTEAYLAASQKASFSPHVPEVSRRVIQNWDYWGLQELAPSEGHAPIPRWLDELVDEMEEAGRPVGEPAKFGLELKPWHMAYSAVQLARRFPVLSDAVDLGLSYFGISAQQTTKLWYPWESENGKLDLKLFKRMAGDKAINAGFNYADLVQQASERELRGQELEIELKRKFPKITDEQIATIEDAMNRKAQSMHLAASTRMQALQDDIAASVSSVFMARDRKMDWKTAHQLGSTTVRLVLNGQEPLAVNLLLKAQVPQPVIDRVMTQAKANQAGYEKVKMSLFGRDGTRPNWYGPMVFSGDYGLVWREQGQAKNSYVAYQTRAQAQKRLDELNARRQKGEVLWVKTIEKKDEKQKYHLLQQDFVEAYREADKIMYEAALSAVQGEDPEAVRFVQEMRTLFEPGDGMEMITTSPYMLPRQGNPAADELDMFKGMTRYLDATAFMAAKRSVKQKQRLILNSPELRENRDLQAWATKYLRTITDPEAREWVKMKNFIFLHYLGGNISSMFVELSQGAMTLVPHLVSKGATLRQGYTEFIRGMKDAGRYLLAKGEAKKTGDSDLDALIEKATELRVVESGFVQELYNIEDVAFAQERHLTKGEGLMETAMNLPKNALYHLLRGARAFYGVTQKANSLAALISAYRWAKKSGMTTNAAGDFAIDTVRTSMFGGGLANRPAATYGIGKAQGVVGAVLALQNYMFNTVSMMARLFSDGIGRSPWLSAEQRKQARKSLGLMLGTQVAFGGVLGLPFVGGLMAVVEQLFPESELKKNLRDSIFSTFEDPAIGQNVAEAAMSGAANVMLPVGDFGARFQLGQFLGVDPYKGFSFENLFGPAGSMMRGWIQGVTDLRHGEFGRLAQGALPSGLRGPARLISEQGVARDSAGRMLYELTPAEKTLTAIGFRPRRTSHLMQQAQMQKRAEEVLADEQSRFERRAADLLLEGRVGEVRTLLGERAQKFPTGYSVVEAVDRITRLAVDKSLAVDPLDKTTRLGAAEAVRTQQMFPRHEGAPEAARLQQQLALKRNLGIPGTLRPSGRQLVNARRVDSLLADNPFLSRTQARQLLQSRSNPRSFRQAYPHFDLEQLGF